ncbi:MAG: type II toxin-antitoxin system VapC family toxin [Opitutales bacterium]|nr:type II toxin-antitoxin system VapC family toxin [Opitutales bacterium]
MNETATVYLETTIPSYLTARPSSNLIIAGEQAITREWWESRKVMFRLFISEAVVEEASRGDAEAARKRLEVISDLEELSIDEPVLSLTREILGTGLIPRKASADAVHIAVAARHGIDYLVTWNCKHIANAEMIRKISHVISQCGYFVPIICTPRELFGGEEDER